MKNNLLLGSGNAGKIKEIKFYLEYFNLFNNFKILDLSSFKDLGEPEENGTTFEENSIIKSTYFYNKTNDFHMNFIIFIDYDWKKINFSLTY